MKKEKVLELVKMGCDFWADEEIKKISDLQNYRLRFNDKIQLNDKYANMLSRDGGIPVLSGDISRGYQMDGMTLCFDFEYYDDKGSCWRPIEIEKELYSKRYRYTSADVLKAINSISKIQYTKVVILEREVLKSE